MPDVEEPSKPSGSRRPLKPGEWVCCDLKCSFINNESAAFCQACCKDKPAPKRRGGSQLGKDKAEKSKGLFSADDWQCTKCGNVNWARRNHCNVCNASRFSDTDMRTGFGGGYNDRQNVEYVKRDLDEEFDEFGRKKKKRSHVKGDEERDVSEPKLDDDAINAAFEDADDDEEEEEDVDEEDLGKYDLTADPDINVDEFAAKNGSSMSKGDAQSDCSSDCTCSCSGGECSCEESEEEKPPEKRLRMDRDRERERMDKGRDRDRHRDSARSHERSRDSRRDRDDRHRSHRHSPAHGRRSRSRDRHHRR